MEVTLDYAVFSAALPARASACSLPGYTGVSLDPADLALSEQVPN